MIPEDFDPTNYPPRYQSAVEHGGFREVVCDEFEWLARPNVWGVEELPTPRREQNLVLSDFYIYTRIIDKFVACRACHSIIRSLFLETGFDIQNCCSTFPMIFDQRPNQEWREWLHSTLGICDCKRTIWRYLRFYTRGICTHADVRNRTIEYLHELTVPVLGRNATPEERQVRQAEREESRLFNRWLALELCGPNPFRPIAFDPAWRSSTAVGIALQMYDSRDFGAMPILADALQDAGCENFAVLNHCREESTHVRGCWVVDLVLEKS